MQQIIECPACSGIFEDGVFKVRVGKPFKQKDYAGRVCQFNTHDPNIKPCINPYYTDESRDPTEKLQSNYPTDKGLDKRAIEILTESLPNFGITDDPTTLFD
jgi:hypothetical protein